MPVSLTITLQDEDVAKFAAAILGGANPTLTSASIPASGKAAKTTKATPKAATPAEEPAEEPATATEPASLDLVTEAQMAAAESTAADADEADMRSQVTDFYISCGMSKKDTQNALATMSVEELRNSYHDYLARLVKDEDGEFTSDFASFYKATRVNEGTEVVCWVRGGVTLPVDEYVANDLEDPNAKPKTVIKKPGLPSRKK